jgi:hypothetical protein
MDGPVRKSSTPFIMYDALVSPGCTRAVRKIPLRRRTWSVVAVVGVVVVVVAAGGCEAPHEVLEGLFPSRLSNLPSFETPLNPNPENAVMVTKSITLPPNV